MKNTKFFVSTLIAAAAMTATAYSEGEVISLNFTNGTEDLITDQAGVAGIVEVEAKGWTNIASSSDYATNNQVKNRDGTVLGGVVVSSKNETSHGTWSTLASTSTLEGTLLRRYWDVDNKVQGVKWNVDVETPFLVCDVYVYLAGDSGEKFASVSVNGISYKGDAVNGASLGEGEWGTSAGTVSATGEISLGENALRVKNVSVGKIEVTNDYVASNIRATLAGIQIVNTYTGTAKNVNLGETEMAWTTSSIGSTDWTNSTAEAGTYAAFNLTENTTVNVSGEGITTDAITASGSGALTLSGNAITLIGPGIVRTDSDTASIVVNNNLTFSNGGAINGNVSLGDSGSISITGGTLSVESIPTDGSISVSEGATLSLSGKQTSKVSATNISGSGMVAIGFTSSSYGGAIDISNDEFAGGVYVSSGNFTINDAKFGNTLQLADGVNFQLTGGSSVEFSKDLVLDGTTQVHQNSGANLTFGEKSSVRGDGTYDRRGGGTLTFSGSVDLGTFMQTSSTGTTVFEGENTTLDSLNASQGSIEFAGAKTTIGEATFFNASFAKGVVTIDGSLSVKNNGATLEIKNGATVFTNSFFGSAEGDQYSIETNIFGVLNIQGEDKRPLPEGGPQTTNSAFLMANAGGINTITVSNGGVLNLFTADVSNRDGTGILNVDTNGEANFGAGLYVRTNHAGWGGATVNLNGGTMNIGSGGIDTDGKANVVVNLKTGTLGSLADAWSSSIDFALGGAVTVDTTKKAINPSGKATATEHGSNVTLSGVLSDATDANGSIKKTGAGTLTLSGANTYTGGTTIEAGTLVAAHQTALGGGNVILSGGSLQVACAVTAGVLQLNSSDISLDLDGALSLSNIVAGSQAPTSVLIDLGSSGSIVASSDINFGTKVKEATGNITIKVDTSTLTSEGRVLFKAGINQWGYGISNLADANALTLIVGDGEFNTYTWSDPTLINATNNAGNYKDVTWIWADKNLSLVLLQDDEGVSTLTLYTIPEPSAFGLLAGVGALALCVSRRRRVKKA